MSKVLYPGSFDPITVGHMNIIDKSIKLFGDVIIAVMKNSSKGNGFFNLRERHEIISSIYKDNPNVTIICIEDIKAVVDVAEEYNCSGIVKGLRNVTDFELEVQMARINKKISKGAIDTIMLVADTDMQDISSSIVRELFRLGKGVNEYVHPIVEESMNKKLK